jgi:nicotinamide-nucleotide amidase
MGDREPHEGELMAQARRFADLAHSRMVALGATVAVGESLTGSLISAVLTEAPGTSVTSPGRSRRVRHRPETQHRRGAHRTVLKEHGPVHSVIAQELAGPGEQDGRPVGEVFGAIAAETKSAAKRYNFDGTRQEIRLAAVAAALSDLVDVLNAATER